MRLLLSFCLFFILAISNVWSQNDLFLKLKGLPNVVEVNKIDLDSNFKMQYEVYFSQPIDHTHPEKERFNQRVIVSHESFDAPVVCVLEGYNIWSGRHNELTTLLHSNQINIEHRFFKDSKPDSIPWDKLTVWQAATDQHVIIKALQGIYNQNWLTTGISKGGQVTMFHKVFYPDDVVMGVPYVAPLNFAREDERIYEFLNTVGTDEQRDQLFDFQLHCFELQDSMLLLLSENAEKHHWTFDFGYQKALEYTILEYPFAFWQWGSIDFSTIPNSKASAKDSYRHLHKVADFTFFEDKKVEEMQPFFWAALTEIGMYGYQTETFAKYLGDTSNYTFDFTAPIGTVPVYNKEVMAYVKKQLDAFGDNMLYVVGGLDTWGSTSFVLEGKTNAVKMVLPNGHHGTRIRNFPENEQEKMHHLIEEWMGLELDD